MGLVGTQRMRDLGAGLLEAARMVRSDKEAALTEDDVLVEEEEVEVLSVMPPRQLQPLAASTASAAGALEPPTPARTQADDFNTP